MRLQEIKKTDALFDRIDEITKLSFAGVEIPPRDILRYEFGRGDVFVAGSDIGTVDSYAILIRKYGGPYLWSIATDPRWRGNGLASQLLNEIEEVSRDAGEFEVSLMTHVDNPAQKLYFDHGYRVLKHIPKYYVTGDGLFMRRKLC